MNLNTIDMEIGEYIFMKMEELLPENKWAKEDFRIDKKTLRQHGGAFIWELFNASTNLVSFNAINFNLSSSPSFRFQYFRGYSECFSEESRIYFYMGGALHQITKEEAENIYNSLITPVIRRYRERYPEEYAHRNDKLELVMTSDTRERLDKSLEYAAKIGDKSLQGCLNRLVSYDRHSLDEKIELTLDFTEHGYQFRQMVDGRCVMNGGIIMDSDDTPRRWSIHT